MNAKQYYTDLQTALNTVDLSIYKVQNKMTDEYDAINYSKTLRDLNNFRRNILQMLAIHKYLRLSEESFMQKAESKSSKSVEIIHTVKAFETPIGIAKKYKMNLEDILKKNNLKTYEIVAGAQLKIDVAQTENIVTQVYEDIPTFGSQEGNLVFGKDASNNMKLSAAGDLAVLEPEDTLKQGVLNRLLTKSGSYLYEDDFGVDSLVGSELPPDLIENMYLMRLNSQILLDKRIDSIESATVIRTGNVINISAQLKAINDNNVTIQTV